MKKTINISIIVSFLCIIFLTNIHMLVNMKSLAFVPLVIAGFFLLVLSKWA
jgi:hypothetical protein